MDLVGPNIAVIKQLMNTDTTSECVLETRVCSPRPGLEKMREYLALHGQDVPDSDIMVTDKMARYLGVGSEKDIWFDGRFMQFIGHGFGKMMAYYFKVNGPANDVTLLNNINIDETIKRWEFHADKLFGRRFRHLPYHMIDFMNTDTPLKDLEFGPGNIVCVVLNSDVSSGRGKHWFCLYIDGTDVEYFNSSGRTPYTAIERWYRYKLHQTPDLKLIRVITRTIQVSHTECGMWSLCYIKSRLMGYPPSWITTCTDADMIGLRANLFIE